jgi:anti-anti-sigma factor
MKPVAEALFYQENDDGLFIRAQGHITAAVSTDLREVILDRLSLAPVPPLLGVDLSACEYMDSTFMGLLVGFHKRYKVLTGRALTILRPTPECVKLLSGLGILKLMSLVAGSFPPSPRMWTGLRANQAPSTEILLNAHQNLSEISTENEKKFSALQNVLEQQLQKKETS